jgi:LuxR family maltose regulon positive regulatory protein
VESLFIWLEAPLITQVRCFIAEGSKQSLKAATKSLQNLKQRCEEWHYTCQIIEIAVLQCLALQKQGRENEALDALKEALSLAEPGRWIRPFVEAGAPMIAMLIQLRKQHDIFQDYTAKLLAALTSNGPTLAPPAPKPKPPSPRAASPQPLVEPLTNRELDVLELLAQRLQNKEIAEKLVVSPKTVKSHLRNVYQKLGVSSRREAVEKAGVLDLLSEN